MSRFEIIDSSILHINTDPAHQHFSVVFPQPVQLSETDFICVYQQGAGMYAPDNNVGRLRSRDGGVTWTDEGFIFDHAGDDRPYSYHSGIPTLLRDGTIIMSAFRADRSDPRQPMYSESGGLIDNESILTFSEDGGLTWRQPQSFLTEMVATAACPIVELKNGQLLAVFDQWHGYDDPKPYEPCMWACYSSDGGRTWDDWQVIADGQEEGKGYWHGKTIRLADDRLYTIFWAADMTDKTRGPVDLPIHFAFADETGRHWDTPQPTTIPGQTNFPAQLPDGRLAAIYTWREAEQPGFMVVLSEDGGRTWDLENQIRVWDTTGWTHIGVSALDKYPRSHDTIAFGAPSLITMQSGDLYASWWCTYASLTHLRWARLRVVD